LNFRMNRILVKTRVSALSVSEETMNDASFVPSDTILECDGQTDGQKDGRTSLQQYQRLHSLLCYCAGKNSCFHTQKGLSFLGPSPRLPTGSLPLDFLPPDVLTSRYLTRNPEYAPELGAAFSTPAFSMHPAILIVPRFPIPHFQSTLNNY